MNLFGFNKQKTKIKKKEKVLVTWTALSRAPFRLFISWKLFPTWSWELSADIGLHFVGVSVHTALSMVSALLLSQMQFDFFKNPFLSPDEIVIFCTRLISQGKQSRKPVSGTKQEQNKSTVVFLKYVHLNTFNLTWGWTLPVNIYFAGEI